MKTKEKNQDPTRYELRRKALVEKSIKARAYRERMLKECEPDEAMFYASLTINDIIADWYRQETGAKEFKTFGQWLAQGKAVKKGEKALLLWAKKRHVTKQEEATTPNGDPTETNYKFYPVAYLFTEKQVEPLTPKTDGNSFETSRN